MRPEPLFNVGDHICVVSPKSCVFGCNNQMLKYANCEGTILSRVWESLDKQYAYRIDVDDSHFMWCESSIAPVYTADIEESDASLDVLFGVV